MNSVLVFPWKKLMDCTYLVDLILDLVLAEPTTVPSSSTTTTTNQSSGSRETGTLYYLYKVIGSVYRGLVSSLSDISNIFTDNIYSSATFY
jgi:hypothetical protein